ncbi:MAG: hypothetical protein M0P01_06450 [Treponema sp.]|nr:hypothetical protein [Treponema sp.]
MKRIFDTFTKIILSVVMITGIQNTAEGETFRIRKLFPLTFTGGIQNEQTITTGINDSISIFLPEDMTYLEGIEVKMEIPDEIAAWRDSVACSLYDGITPAPDISQIDYSGVRSFVRPLPNRLSWILQIPLKAQNSIKETPYATKTDIIPDTKKHFVFIRIQPAMKGIPEDAQNAQLKITVRPLLIDKGKLHISAVFPDQEKPYTVFIDNNEMKPSATGYLLDTGIHDVSIVSEFYRGEVRTVRVEQAKMTELAVSLKSITPTLLITAPDNTVVYLDDVLCDKIGKAFDIAEGEHKIRFLMGDYEVIRTIVIQKGKSYTAALSVDLKVTEE